MALLNEINKAGKITKGELRDLLLLINPFAPHITEEMWQISGFSGMLNEAKWPVFDESKTIDNEIEVAVQINGKVRDKIVVSKDISKEEMEAAAFAREAVKAYTDGKTIVKVIYVPGKLFNIVVK